MDHSKLHRQMTNHSPVRSRCHRLSEPGEEPQLETLSQRWAESDPAAALQWADSLPPGALKDAVNAQVLFVVSRFKPTDAAQGVMQRIADPAIRDEAVISVVHQWAQQDAELATRWVAEMPPGALRDRALAEIESISTLKRTEGRP